MAKFSLKRYARQFFGIDNLLSLVLGAILLSAASTALLWVMGFLPDFTNNWRYWLFAFLCFLLICVTVSFLTATSGSPRRARFRMRPMILGTGLDPEQKAMAMTVLALYNNGAPSIADGWEMTVTIPEMAPVKGDRVQLPPIMNIQAIEGGTRTFLASDALYEKSIVAPLANGGMVTGILQFRFDTLSKDQINRGDASFTVKCFDSRGEAHEITFDRSMMPHSGTSRHVPGIQTQTPPQMALIPGTGLTFEMRIGPVAPLVAKPENEPRSS